MPRTLDGRRQGREGELVEIREGVFVLGKEVRESVFGLLEMWECWEVRQRGELFAEGIKVVHKRLEKIALLVVPFVLEHGSVFESVRLHLGEEERCSSLWVVFWRVRVAGGSCLLVFNEWLGCAVEVSVFEARLFHCPLSIRALLLDAS